MSLPVEEAGSTVILPYERTQEYTLESLGVLPRKPLYAFCKRTFDILASFFALILLFVPMAVIACIVALDSPGGAFYRQERLGKNGKPFMMIKFRSMRADAEKNGAQWSQGDHDDRITKIGAFLRKTRLDELPQLWCIFIGNMSIVGPRPERACFYDEFECYIHGFRERLKVTPGLTGLAQVNGGYDLRPEEKIVYDLTYIRTRSIFLDLKIIFQTVGIIFTHKGAK